MVEKSDLDVEIQSLRQELKLRILLQNLLLQGLLVIFAALGAGAALQPEASAALCLVFQCVMLAGVLQWCHHGIRTAQIKALLQEIDPEEAHGKWETWLPAHRPATLLGSRWMVSTKGVFLGLGAVMLLLGPGLSADNAILSGLASALVWTTAAAFLFTNPKE
jgi:hypothetical protein